MYIRTITNSWLDGLLGSTFVYNDYSRKTVLKCILNQADLQKKPGMSEINHQ